VIALIFRIMTFLSLLRMAFRLVGALVRFLQRRKSVKGPS